MADYQVDTDNESSLDETQCIGGEAYATCTLQNNDLAAASSSSVPLRPEMPGFEPSTLLGPDASSDILQSIEACNTIISQAQQSLARHDREMAAISAERNSFATLLRRHYP